MKRRLSIILTLILFLTAVSQPYQVYARGTVISVTRTYAAPRGVSMFTDVYIRSERNVFRAYDNDDRNVISLIGNGRIRGAWESDIDYILRAPEVLVRFNRNMPEGTEFQIRLHNLVWFFRSVEQHYPSIFIDDDYSGGIELLLPSNYNRHRGLFVPSGTGTGGVYTRIITPADYYEARYKLVICDTNDREATVTLLQSVRYGYVARIPLIAKASDYTSSASVEIIGTSDGIIRSGLHSVLCANALALQEMRRNPTTTVATVHMTGVEHIRIPEIVIRENTHGIIGSGSIILTAPEGFIIVPDVDCDQLGRITRRTPYLRDADGNPIINITLGGGLSWRDRLVYPQRYRRDSVPGTDFRLHYRGTAGNINASVLVIDFTNIVQSRFRSPGYVVISGLRLVATGDVESGAKHMEIAPFAGIEYLTAQSFRVGTIVE